jgi:phosphoserine phosphatase
MTKLIIIRHAESHYNLQNRIQGHHDSALTKLGLRQSHLLAKRLKNFSIDKVYTSDLGRAVATTLEITRYLKVKITRDPLLREIHLGDWEGRTPAEVDELYDKGYQKWLKKPSVCIIPKGERLAHFKKRISDRVRSIARANRGKTVLIVTHGGAITALLTEWLKADFDRLLLNLHLENTGMTLAEETDKRVRLHAINDTSHLSSKEKSGSNIFNRRS